MNLFVIFFEQIGNWNLLPFVQYLGRSVGPPLILVKSAPDSYSLKNEHSPGEIRDSNPGEPVDDPQDGEDGDAQPPEPEDQEVLLVEEVVREDAEVVAPVYASGCSSNTDIARNLNTTFLIFHKKKILFKNYFASNFTNIINFT